ncbi:MAG: hypothetical protein CO129_09340 [Ignavibacteriales bacterium CG_4_9_14_3_um_filter_34_10]|nr:MAG: hypothetical protein CO129_09340 [Ignavibacteriales bacterium CG_4_9_14_3_um_filter_34_10]
MKFFFIFKTKKGFFLKRFFDIIFAIFILPFALLIILISAIIIVFELKEFPFFTQTRGITIENGLFKIYKLKTIKNSQSNNTRQIKSKNILLKPDLSEYIPYFARLLRKTGLDELPQIFNIIKGDMSFVGPRPLMLSDLQAIKENFPELYKIRGEIKSKPGLTGLWQIFCDRDEGARNLIALDKIYEEAHNLIFDIKILLFTVPLVLTGNNTDSIIQNKKNIIINLFNISNTTRFKLYKKLQILNRKKNSNYVVEIPGDWWYNSNSVISSSKDAQVKIKAEKRRIS